MIMNCVWEGNKLGALFMPNVSPIGTFAFSISHKQATLIKDGKFIPSEFYLQ